jgi:hypothetical protein
MNDTTAAHPTETSPPAKLIFVTHPILIALVLLLTCAATPLRAQTGSLTCASDDGDYHYCRANHCNAITAGGVDLHRQRGQAPCQQNYSWRVDNSGVWVSHGCRADFVLHGVAPY